ncbi:unnamed protein product, partial [Meganyctiphanes norvegica]
QIWFSFAAYTGLLWNPALLLNGYGTTGSSGSSSSSSSSSTSSNVGGVTIIKKVPFFAAATGDDLLLLGDEGAGFNVTSFNLTDPTLDDLKIPSTDNATSPISSPFDDILGGPSSSIGEPNIDSILGSLFPASSNGTAPSGFPPFPSSLSTTSSSSTSTAVTNILNQLLPSTTVSP